MLLARDTGQTSELAAYAVSEEEVAEALERAQAEREAARAEVIQQYRLPAPDWRDRGKQ